MRLPRVVRHTGMGLLAALVVGAVAWQLRGQDWSGFATLLTGRDAGFVVTMTVLAVLANAAGLIATKASWRAMLTAVGEEIQAVDAARIFYIGQFTKYLPGKVFGLAITVQMGRNVGVRASRMAAAWLLALVTSLLTGATVGLLAAPEIFGASAGWLVLAALPIAVALIRPDLLGSAAALLARLRRRPIPDLTISPRHLRQAVCIQLAAWLIGGTHLWLLAWALGAPAARSLPLCVGAFSLGAVIGVLAVFAPDGIGVREAVLLGVLSVLLPVTVAAALAVASRLVVVLSELATAGVGLLINSSFYKTGVKAWLNNHSSR